MTSAVERLGPGDAEALRAIRIEALKLHPDCFCADLDAAEALTVKDWEDRLQNGAWFGAKKNGVLISMIAFMRPASKKVAHTGELMSMYVRAEERGSGAADALIRAVIGHAVTVVDQIKLTVNAENARAVKLYERHGFRIVGRIPRVIRVGDKLYDELVMVRGVSPSD